MSPGISLLIALFVASELAGITPTMAGGARRLEGPLGKVDRSIILSVLAIVIAIFGRLPESASVLVPMLAVGAITTIWNRVRFALHQTAAAQENRSAESPPDHYRHSRAAFWLAP